MPRRKQGQSKWDKISKQHASKPRKDEVEPGKAAVDRITHRRTFEYYDKPQVGVRFHLFRQKDDELRGRLVSHSITNIRRNSSYAIELDDGDVVEIFANKMLHKQLVDCFEQVIRIVYIGRDQNSWGHATKIYRVYKETAAKPKNREDSGNGRH